ncbi:hypothetical protein [Streptomyces chromofuscus]|uniref:hypothetical protein n=1 Tax=Streptomyces chromofuscus TaxID=42881 RepID=UPI0019B53079|nr:hypothetical protein [Streptomyces chromofuscus]GGT38381.1 hypothetical protein GCM10010254_68060 [Streptomyces chromofuscus]
MPLGSGGVHGITGFLVGSVAPAVIASVHRPVVHVRAEKSTGDEHLPDADGPASATTAYRDVVLGHDLNRPHEDPLAFALEAAAHRAARLRVVHGGTLPPNVPRSSMVLPDLIRAVTSERDAALTETLRPRLRKYPEVDASGAPCLVEVGRRVRRSAVGRQPHRSGHARRPASQHHAGGRRRPSLPPSPPRPARSGG